MTKKPSLANHTSTNETFLHRKDGGLGDDLVKQQIRAKEAAEKSRSMEEVPLRAVVDELERETIKDAR